MNKLVIQVSLGRKIIWWVIESLKKIFDTNLIAINKIPISRCYLFQASISLLGILMVIVLFRNIPDPIRPS